MLYSKLHLDFLSFMLFVDVVSYEKREKSFLSFRFYSKL